MHPIGLTRKNLRFDITGAADFLGRLPVLYALQRSLALTLPLVMVSAIALLLLFPPFPSLKNTLDNVFGPQFEPTLWALVGSTFGVAALLVLIGYAFVYTSLINKRDGKYFVSPVLSVLVAVSCFFLLAIPADQSKILDTFSINRGLPVAILVAIFSTSMFLRLVQVRSLRLRSRTIGHEGIVGDVFALMPAVMLTIMFFGVIKAALASQGSTDIVSELNRALGFALANGDDTLSFGLAFSALSQVFWFFGIHGPNVLQSVYDGQLKLASSANNSAVALGDAPSNIFTSQFFDLQNMGGSGATLGLVLAMFLFCKSPGMRNFALVASIPAVCNINEPLIYGIPIVLNPIYAIPFLLTPLLNTVIMYLAMSLEIMPLTSHHVAWTTPPIMNGYAVTGSINGAVVQAVCLVVSVAVYAPFVKIAERVDVLRGETALRGLSDLAVSGAAYFASGQLLTATGDQKRLALTLARDLELELKRRENFFLEYQPQICWQNSKVMGTEALLRWQHPVHGLIPPPVTVQLAEELGVMQELGTLVLEMACSQRASWRELVPNDFLMSVNVAPTQILNGNLDDTVFQILEKHDLPTFALKLEITETTMLIPDDEALSALERLREQGVRISLDDFGMGHTSLRYLKALPLDEVKIDKSLAQSELSDVNEHIILSIQELSRSLGFRTIVEGVETEEQLTWLTGLGCTQFQGYYFSRPLSPEQCMHYVLSVSQQTEAVA